MRGWVRWAAGVLVPVVLYVGAYVGCCRWPRWEPIVQQWNARARVVQTVFAPLMYLHGRWVEAWAAEAMAGRWEPADGSGGLIVEIGPAAGDREHLMFGLKVPESGELELGSLEWVPGTARVRMAWPRRPQVEFAVVDGEHLEASGLSGSSSARARLRRVAE